MRKNISYYRCKVCYFYDPVAFYFQSIVIHTKGKPFGERWARNINTKMRNRCWQLRDNFLTWRRMKQWYLFCHSVLSDLEFIFRWFQSISLAVNTSSLFQRPLMSIWAFPFTLLSFDRTLESSNLISAFGGFLPMGMDHFYFHVYQCCTMEI